MSSTPSGSPLVTASPPAASTTTPPTSSNTPPTPSPAETPAPPPPAPISTPPPAAAPPPPSSTTSPPTSPPPPSPPPAAAPPSSSTTPPTSTSTSPPPPPSSTTPPPTSPTPPSPPPAVPAPSSSTTPPTSTSTSPPPPPPLSSTSPPASPPSSATSPTSTSTPQPPPSSSPPAPDTQSPPSPAQPPPPPKQSSLSPTPSPSSVADASSPPPPPITNSIRSPPPPLASALSPSPTTPSTPTTPSPPTQSSSSSIPTSTLAAILVTGILAASVVLILVYCFCKKKKKKIIYYSGDHHHGPPGVHNSDSYYDPNTKQQGWHSPHSQSSDVLLNMPPLPSSPPFMMQHDLASPKVDSGASQSVAHSKSWFTYVELAKATDGFSNSNLLGEGGFGCVYKGVLANGQVVAVKQLKSGASQGEREFQAEVEIISRVHHRHLVSLVGYCIAESQRLLVYDYVPNNTLEYHLHKRKGGPVMDWATRIKVASGAARGLAYLHEDCHPRIIHRDIKSANILLDNNFEAQVSDFGLAKLTSDANTHVTTRVMGTFGYLAPEYASSGKLTEKSDVFSFGVVLLELLTGRKPVDVSRRPGEESLVEWARPILAQVESEEDLEMLVDPSLNGFFNSKEIMRMAEAAAACVRHSANKRPRMGQVVRALEDEISLSDLASGLKPGHSTVYGSSFSSTDYENGSYSEDMRRFRMALNENNNT